MARLARFASTLLKPQNKSLVSSLAGSAFRAGAFSTLTKQSVVPEQSVLPHKLPTDPSHTSKWQYEGKSPMELIAEVPPIAVDSRIAECYGGENPSLGHPVEYIILDDTSADFPAVCKYCGLRFFRDHH
ncbi:hypothetical protein CYMTET_6177 [Cymbomonas tetramitiformis]|uniref:Zinc finger CHCC-type domain-containing protein n=1 Tax=Cymbomonas tetramitiformis TaxID=36881 RepID=A0AAE0GXN2_9CHLO|nr:hypothetical protein CYMTET_6177 [Cymbomonas tetramitiformis]